MANFQRRRSKPLKWSKGDEPKRQHGKRLHLGKIKYCKKTKGEHEWEETAREPAMHEHFHSDIYDKKGKILRKSGWFYSTCTTPAKCMAWREYMVDYKCKLCGKKDIYKREPRT